MMIIIIIIIIITITENITKFDTQIFAFVIVEKLSLHMINQINRNVSVI